MQFRRESRSELLNVLRKHLWNKHRAWMIARIKAGKAKGRSNPHTPLTLIRDIITGNIVPGYSGYKKAQYDAVRPIMQAIVSKLPPYAQSLWKVVDEVARRVYK